jgi:hypothetical protein
MAVFDYHDLLAHVGHSFECIVYGDKQNVALACNDCYEVIINFDRPDFDNALSKRLHYSTTNCEEIARNLTENEKVILRGSCDNEFANVFEENNLIWVFTVIETSSLSLEVARDTISSLVKKGIIEFSGYEGKRKIEDMMIALTELGKAVYSIAFLR